MKTKKIAMIGILTALYVVLSAFLKINVIGNIQLDIGYLAFTVGLCAFGVWGSVVGVVGCALESLLFSAYGFSISWVVANAIIGIGCGIVFMRTEKIVWRILAVMLFCAVGLLGAKTMIECYLYSIPLAVKIPKNAVAFAIDCVVMVGGLALYSKVLSKHMSSRK